MHPAGAPLRLCASRPAVRAEWPAATCRDGRHVRGCGDPCGRRRRVGRAGQRVRADRGDRASWAVRHHAAVPSDRGLGDATGGCRGRVAVTAGPCRGSGGFARAAVVSARHRDRLSVGAVRRADPRPDPHRRGAGGCQHRDVAVAARLCRRRRNVACARPPPRRPRIRSDEALAGRRRVDTPRIGRCGAGRRRRNRARARYRLPHPALDRVHLELRTVAARSRVRGRQGAALGHHGRRPRHDDERLERHDERERHDRRSGDDRGSRHDRGPRHDDVEQGGDARTPMHCRSRERCRRSRGRRSGSILRH